MSKIPNYPFKQENVYQKWARNLFLEYVGTFLICNTVTALSIWKVYLCFVSGRGPANAGTLRRRNHGYVEGVHKESRPGTAVGRPKPGVPGQVDPMKLSFWTLQQRLCSVRIIHKWAASSPALRTTGIIPVLTAFHKNAVWLNNVSV